MELLDGKTKTKRSPNEEVVEEVEEEAEGEDGEKKNFEGLHGWIAHTHTRLQLALAAAPPNMCINGCCCCAVSVCLC